MRSAFRWIAILLLTGLFCTNVYRAVTQSIVHDEAITYECFLRGPFSDVWTKYNANNHLLHTFLCRISTGLFGVSDLTLRLPSLLGGGLYLFGVYRLTREVFRDGPLFLLAVGMLSLNPFVLDYLSAARGYGMACAFLLWAIYFFLQLLMRPPEKKAFWKLGLSAGLAVAANLTLLFPIIALGMVLLGWCWLTDRRGRQVWMALVHSIAPALLTMAVVITIPFCYALARVLAKHAATREANKLGVTGAATHRAFYVGAPTLRISFESMVRSSFFRSAPRAGLSTLEPMTGLPAAEALVIACIVATAMGYGGKRAIDVVRKGTWPTTPSGKLLILVSSTMIVASGGVFIAHAALGYPYPELRTGLYWIPLATLATVALMAEVRRELAITLSLFSIGIVVQYAANFQTSYYLEWRYSAGARPIMERIRSLKPAGTTQPLIVGATWLLEPSLNFYRDIFHLDWFEEILPLGSGGERKSLEETECDFYVLWEDDRSLASKRQLRVLMDDPVSEAMLAIPEPHN